MRCILKTFLVFLNFIRGLLPIEWVIFRNLDVMAVFDDDTLLTGDHCWV
jgi:hypothetical protein